ncbi:hypothetical protein RRG08_015178 [Elysia crispata]|uniref:Uncharacterized protein n=1 Tax=Elysia crispata TaxID=231223 RepID=A0AAE1CW41_9GAST|nr:hypothetical protein RRG08_015178 [Elysia crispata]
MTWRVKFIPQVASKSFIECVTVQEEDAPLYTDLPTDDSHRSGRCLRGALDVVTSNSFRFRDNRSTAMRTT